jgi:tRNA G37 N-methylase TrmD
MALYDWITRVRMFPMVDMNIRSAYTDSLDAQQHFARPGSWNLNIPDFYLSGFGHYRLFHH